MAKKTLALKTSAQQQLRQEALVKEEPLVPLKPPVSPMAIAQPVVQVSALFYAVWGKCARIFYANFATSILCSSSWTPNAICSSSSWAP